MIEIRVVGAAVGSLVGVSAVLSAGLSQGQSVPEVPSSLVVFGDSLSDTGNFASLFGGLFPPPPYFEGRFSNGPLWVERFADRLQVEISTNAAWAGDDSNDLVNRRLPGYLNANPVADADALHVIYIGGNDLSDNALGVMAVPGIRTQIANRIAGNVRETIIDLHATGAQRFLLMNMSDIGATPEADFIADASGNAGVPEGLRLASIETNDRLRDEAQSLRAMLEIDLFEFDTFGLFEDLIDNPEQFGFTDTDRNVLQPDVTLIGDPDEFVFWDNLHPTGRAHELLGDAVFEAFIPAPGTGVMLAVGLVAVRRRR